MRENRNVIGRAGKGGGQFCKNNVARLNRLNMKQGINEAAKRGG